MLLLPRVLWIIGEWHGATRFKWGWNIEMHHRERSGVWDWWPPNIRQRRSINFYFYYFYYFILINLSVHLPMNKRKMLERRAEQLWELIWSLRCNTFLHGFLPRLLYLQLSLFCLLTCSSIVTILFLNVLFSFSKVWQFKDTKSSSIISSFEIFTSFEIAISVR